MVRRLGSARTPVNGERSGKTDLVIACANGVAAAFKAIDEDRARPPDDGKRD
jgi:hypothetical protein